MPNEQFFQIPRFTRSSKDAGVAGNSFRSFDLFPILPKLCTVTCQIVPLNPRDDPGSSSTRQHQSHRGIADNVLPSWDRADAFPVHDSSDLERGGVHNDIC